MRIAITGTTGRVGRALAGHFAARHEVIELPRAACDLADPACAGVLSDLDFDVLLNPGGLTNLEQCEDEPDLARRVNAAAPAELAKACRERGKKILHFSTDYVFDGIQPGLMEATLERDAVGTLVRKAGVMAVVVVGGTVRAGDVVEVELRDGPRLPLEPV